MKKYRITPDDEYNAEEFWEQVYIDIEKKNKVAKLLLGNGGLIADEIIVSEKEKNEIISYCEDIERWNDGPNYAPNPLIINEIED